MTVEKFINKNTKEYNNTFYSKENKETESTLSTISEFLFKPIFKVENFTIKMIS